MIEEIPRQHIMLVEDDMSLAEWFSDYLTEHGYLVTLVNRGDVAVELIKADMPELVVLDIMLPVKDGFDVCKEARNFYQGPILMMTARDDEMDEILGLELGADDYVTKPVKPRVLLSRIKALLRRVKTNANTANVSENQIQLGQLSINANSRATKLHGQYVAISSNEFDLLWYLAQSAGQVVNRTELFHQLNGIDYDGFDRRVDIVISRLRKKLGDDANNPYRIKTVWGKGYLLVADAWS
ncbi:winged helix-turn-helix domain-containing protein [Pseudoalteromonas sp. Ld20]|uniref:winged helix-turn-helix domain-containing protein n=1 Tax=Pseudoalteromonas sp. Ld20 TaxID=649165 RepID=UPI0038667B33